MDPTPPADRETYTRTLAVLERLVDVAFSDALVLALVQADPQARRDFRFVTDVLAHHRAGVASGGLTDVLTALEKVQRVLRAAW